MLSDQVKPPNVPKYTCLLDAKGEQIPSFFARELEDFWPKEFSANCYKLFMSQKRNLSH